MQRSRDESDGKQDPVPALTPSVKLRLGLTLPLESKLTISPKSKPKPKPISISTTTARTALSSPLGQRCLSAYTAFTLLIALVRSRLGHASALIITNIRRGEEIGFFFFLFQHEGPFVFSINHGNDAIGASRRRAVIELLSPLHASRALDLL
eukprot:TRINITY_DN514_c0_g4_i1.p1 TRINITY_DN514_c0_g4~~TRINITY_DN514_c0_g4_i1.p1  ORF type:complete len:152 (+),score=24.04 TRINITY_DN514_c0_g4_i1:520-975(+)